MVTLAVLVAWMGTRVFKTDRVLHCYSDIELASQRVMTGSMGIDGALLAYVASPTIENLQSFFDQRLAVDTETNNLVISARGTGQDAAARAIRVESDRYLSKLDAVFNRAERARSPRDTAALKSIAPLTQRMLDRMNGFTDATERARSDAVKSLTTAWLWISGAFAMLALVSVGVPVIFAALTLRRFETRIKRLSDRAARAALGEELRDPDPIRDVLGDFDRALGRIAQKVREKNETSAHALEMKSRFVATVSHEIRTPLNGIIGLGEILLRSALDADQREVAQTLQDSSTALLEIINDILDFSKLEAGRIELESVDFRPGELIDNILDLLSRAVASKPVNLLTYVSPSVPAIVRGDPGRLRQVLLNLVGNAAKFTSNGYVLVSVDLESANESTAFVRFDVVDSGIGMSPEVQSRLFQPFSQGDASTTRQFGGTGLGLAISKGLVEIMRGRIEVCSELGRGTTMSFTIPLGIVQAASSKPHAHLLEGVRTLILSRDPGTRDVLQRYAAGWRMPASVIEDPEKLAPALRAAALREEPFGLALVDCTTIEGPCNLCSRVLGDPLIEKTPLLVVNGNPQCAGPFLHNIPKAILQSEVYNGILAVIAPELAIRSAGGAIEAPPEEKPMTIGGRALRVLVAEDNAINRKVVARQLAILGAEYAMAENGMEAIERIANDSFDVVLMDGSMPVMDGFTATREIRVSEIGTERHVPIVAMTANASPADRARCLACGMDDYVAKPVTLDALRTVLTRTLLADRLSTESA